MEFNIFLEYEWMRILVVFHLNFFVYNAIIIVIIIWYVLRTTTWFCLPHVLGVSYGQAVSKRTLQNETKSALYSLASLLCMW